MDFVEVPPDTLSEGALRGLVEEFVTREGTDYGDQEHSLEQKLEAVLGQLRRREVVITFEMESDSCTLVRREELLRGRP